MSHIAVPHSLTFKTKFAIAVFACGLIGTIAVSARRAPATASKTADPAAKAIKFDPVTVQPQQNSDAPQVDLIAILPTGFEPAKYTRPKGRFILAVINRSGLEEVTLQLYREAGDKLHEVNVPRSKLDWSDIFDLPPGSYVLKEVNHPEWACEISVTAN